METEIEIIYDGCTLFFKKKEDIFEVGYFFNKNPEELIRYVEFTNNHANIIGNFLLNKDIKNQYENSVNAYVLAFEKKYEIDFEFWVGDEVGTVALFADYYISFETIKFCVDNNVEWFKFVLWYSYIMDINLKSFIKLYDDFIGLYKIYSEKNFKEFLTKLQTK